MLVMESLNARIYSGHFALEYRLPGTPIAFYLHTQAGSSERYKHEFK